MDHRFYYNQEYILLLLIDVYITEQNNHRGQLYTMNNDLSSDTEATLVPVSSSSVCSTPDLQIVWMWYQHMLI